MKNTLLHMEGTRPNTSIDMVAVKSQNKKRFFGGEEHVKREDTS